MCVDCRVRIHCIQVVGAELPGEQDPQLIQLHKALDGV